MKPFVAMCLALFLFQAGSHFLGAAGDEDEERAAYLKEYIKLLHDADPEKRHVAAEGLHRLGGMAVRPLMEILRSKNPEAPRSAAQALAYFRRRAKPAVPLLIEMLADRDDKAKYKAIVALGSIGPKATAVVPRLIEIVRQERETEFRVAAVEALGKMGSQAKAALPVLTAALKDPEPRVRQQAAESIVEAGIPEAAVPALLDLVKDKDAEVRAAVVLTLGRIRPVKKEIVLAIVGAIRDPDEYVALYASISLIDLPKEAEPALIPAVSALDEALKDPKDSIRRHAAIMLHLFPLDHKARLPKYIAALRDRDEVVRRVAALILVTIGPAAHPAIPDLRRLLDDPNEDVRSAAAAALRAIGKAAASAFQKDLVNPNQNVRLCAMKFLFSLETNEPARALAILEGLKNWNSQVYDEAIQSLAAFDISKLSPQTIAEINKRLVLALKDPDPLIREKAARGLKAMGSKAPAAVPALMQVLDDPHTAVRQQALEALASIGPAAKAAVGRIVAILENTPAGPQTNEKLSRLIAELGSDVFAVRSKAMEELEKVGRAAYLPIRQALKHRPSLEARRRLEALLKKVDDQDAALGSSAAHALGKIGPEAGQAVPTLIAVLRDENRASERRIAAADALGKIKPEDPEVVAALAALLEHPDRTICFNVAEVFFAMDPAAMAAKPALIKALGRKETAYPAARAIAKLGPEAADAVPALIALVRKNVKASEAAADALRELGPAAKQAIPALIDALKDRESYAAAAAAETLGHFGPDARAAVPSLIRALVAVDGGVIHYVQKALPKIDPDWQIIAAPILIQELKNAKKRDIRCIALGQLTKLGPAAKDALPVLLPLLQNPDDDIRLASVCALAAIGPAARQALPRLIPMLDDDSDEVCAAVTAALEKIDTQEMPRRPSVP